MAVEHRHLGFLPSAYDELPEPVLEQIFTYLKVPQVLASQLVCSAWKEYSSTTQFWWTRLQKLGIKMNQEILANANEFEYLRLLQSICLCKENDVSKIFSTKIWKFEEENILEAISYLVLSHTPSKIILRLRSEPESINFLETLLKIVSSKACFLEIKDTKSWRESTNSSGWLLNQLNACRKCEVLTIGTSATSTDHLPTNVRNLYLTYKVDPATQTLMELPLCESQQRYPVLAALGVHVPAGYATNHLQAVPNARTGTYLYLSGLATDEHITAAVAAARQLQPSSGWFSLRLPQCTLTASQLMQLWQGLGQAQCKVLGSVELTRRAGISDQEQQEQSSAIKAALPDCYQGAIWVEDDESISDW